MANTINKSQLNQVRTGWGLLVHGKSLLSRIIVDFEKAPYSHAAMFLRLIEDTTINGKVYPIGLYVVEMLANGFCITDFDDYVDGTDDLMILQPTYAVDAVAYQNYIIPDLGHERYGFCNLCIFQPIKFLTNYRIWMGDVDDEHPYRFICGEKFESIVNHFNPEYFVNWMRDDPGVIYRSTLYIQFTFVRQ